MTVTSFITVQSVVSAIALYLAIKFVATVYGRITQLRSLPGPPLPSIFYGHELQIRQAPTSKYYKPWMKEYGHIYRTRGAFSVRSVIVSANFLLNLFDNPVGIFVSREQY